MRIKKMKTIIETVKIFKSMKTPYKVPLNLWNMTKMMIDSKCWKCSKK